MIDGIISAERVGGVMTFAGSGFMVDLSREYVEDFLFQVDDEDQCSECGGMHDKHSEICSVGEL